MNNLTPKYTGKVAWKSPSNIALVKYWGKKQNQIPITPSLSISLQNSLTECAVEYFHEPEQTSVSAELFFEGTPADPAFAQKTLVFLNKAASLFPVLQHYRMVIHSRNTFPHSAGMASSASSMSALALCLCSVVSEGSGPDFFQQASALARLGSGSACRSVYGGYALWGATPLYPESSDQYAIPLNDTIHPVFRNYGDAIIVVHAGKKNVSSSEGHALMHSHFFLEGRISQANRRMERLMHILKSGNQYAFAELVETEALTLHALMMSSDPAYILLEEGTIAILKKIKKFRKESRIPVAFTLDAGPNVHILYPWQEREQVLDFIQRELVMHCEEGKWIDDQRGNGPERIY